MISIAECRASWFFTQDPSYAEGSMPFSGDCLPFSTGYFTRFQRIGSFVLFIFRFARCLVCENLLSFSRSRAPSSGWSPNLSVTPENVSQPPLPLRGRVLDFHASRPCLLPINPCIWHCTVSAFCASRLTWFLGNPRRYWLYVVFVS